jgi:hypothetical protein
MGGKKKKAKKAGDGEEVDPLEELRKKYKKVHCPANCVKMSKAFKKIMD